jgi:hypothetical protein
MTANDDAPPRREWSAESDGTQYSLTLERGQITVSYYSPPEYHYMLSDHCSAAEFVDGKSNGYVRQVFGEAVLAEVLDIALGELAKKPPEGR